MPGKHKSPAAALAALRWETTKTTEAHSQAARENGKLGGRPRSKQKRCACGAMTLKRAIARGHHC